ncbi:MULTISPECIES: Gfo/Idh/MocA family oxidoreductase [unclassified Burkholderia]|uniref:Gfo/Idh/MocA family protein n=1 Tax=unclassified Burkholderia TaxID=2613784 RepID=UPI002AB25C41|nr:MULTISPECIES: Gfo/Idh/MocA family oxidoreductase [unclassified Burkholderia]
MIRYAVVGAGWISQEAFMPAVAQTGNSTIGALVSGNPDGACKLARFYGVDTIVGYDDYERMLNSDVVDAVYIAVPNPLHADYAIRAARAGKHVLVEKPMATSIADAEAMIAAAARAGVLLSTCYRLHHEAGTIAALEAIREGRIGDPKYFSGVFGFQSATGNHRLDSKNWGGPLQDIGIYCVNAARHVFSDEPVDASAITTRRSGDPRFSDIDDAIAVTLRFPRDRIAQFYCSFGTASIDMYRVLGTEGDLTMEPGFRFETPTRMVLNTKDASETMHFRHCDHFGGMIQQFSECIQRGSKPAASVEEGLADLKTLLAIEASARTGTVVPVELTRFSRRNLTLDDVRAVPRTEKRLLL